MTDGRLSGRRVLVFQQIHLVRTDLRLGGHPKSGQIALIELRMVLRLTALIPFIKTFIQPSDTILDPFAGSGSTLLAAKRLGRNIGIELNSSYHADCPKTAYAQR